MLLARATILPLTAGLLLATGVAAQVLEVPGDFETIQAALDAAPAGAVVVVHGGTWESITIQRPVSLIGSPAPLLDAFGMAPPIVLMGPGSGEVTLTRIRTAAMGLDALPTSPPAIAGGGFAELHVYESEILAPERVGFSGLGYGSSAIDTDIPFVLVERSLVKASRTDIDDACTSAREPAPGIRATGTVVVLDSRVVGGDSGQWQYPGWPDPQDCDAQNCPYGPGGTGIVCSTLYHAGSAIEGGRGARWSTCLIPTQFCCENPPGPSFVVQQENPLSNDLTSDGPMFFGRDYVLQLDAPGPLARLLVAFGVNPPVLVPGLGETFLAPATTISLGAVASPGQLRIRIPRDPLLLGRSIAFQLVDPTNGFSRPVTGMPLPQKIAPHDAPAVTKSRSL